MCVCARAHVWQPRQAGGAGSGFDDDDMDSSGSGTEGDASALSWSVAMAMMMRQIAGRERAGLHERNDTASSSPLPPSAASLSASSSGGAGCVAEDTGHFAQYKPRGVRDLLLRQACADPANGLEATAARALLPPPRSVQSHDSSSTASETQRRLLWFDCTPPSVSAGAESALNDTTTSTAMGSGAAAQAIDSAGSKWTALQRVVTGTLAESSSPPPASASAAGSGSRAFCVGEVVIVDRPLAGQASSEATQAGQTGEVSADGEAEVPPRVLACGGTILSIDHATNPGAPYRVLLQRGRVRETCRLVSSTTGVVDEGLDSEESRGLPEDKKLCGRVLWVGVQALRRMPPDNAEGHYEQARRYAHQPTSQQCLPAYLSIRVLVTCQRDKCVMWSRPGLLLV